MVLAVAVIAIAPGAVAELQLRMGNIRPAADSAPVGIGCLGGGSGSLIGACIEGNGLMLLVGSSVLCTFCGSSCIDPPGLGQYIQDICAEEQEVIGQRNDAEKIIGEGRGKEIKGHDHQVNQSEEPGLHRNDEEQQKMGIGIHGGVAQEEAQVQVGHIRLSAEDQAPQIHHHHAG